MKEGFALFGMRGSVEGELGRDIVVRFEVTPSSRQDLPATSLHGTDSRCVQRHRPALACGSGYRHSFQQSQQRRSGRCCRACRWKSPHYSREPRY